MARPAVGVWLTTLLWTATGLGLWAYYDRELAGGDAIELKAIPVDPRDPLRGDYVVLRYGVSTVPRGNEASRLGVDDTVYVAIAGGEDGGEWGVEGLHREPPPNGRFLRGRVRRADPASYEIVYGIERFYVPEGEGRRYEEARNRDRLWAIVRVSPRGVAYLERLEIR